MSTKPLLFISILLILCVFLLNGFAQDYTQWHLPDGAKTRIGKGSIGHISFSPDGTRFAVATSIGVWIYDAQTGKEISLIKVNYRGLRLRDRVAFSPDGKTFATGNWLSARGIELWDVETGEKITTLKKHIGGVYDLEFSPDGKMLSCGSLYKGVEYHMWEVDSGREVAKFKEEQESYSYSVFEMSPGARLIASAGKGKIFLWDTATRSLKHALDLPESYIWGLTFSPDNKTLVSSGNNVILWDTETGKQISKLDRQIRTVNPLTYSPDGKILAGGSYGGKIILWDMEQLNQQPKDQNLTLLALLNKVVNKRPSDSKHPTLVEHTLSIETLAFTADSKTLASGSRDGTVIVWDVANRTPKLTVDGHTGSVTALRFLENDQILFSVSSDGIARIWNTDTGAEKFIKTNWYAFTIAFPQDGKTVAFRSSSNEIQIWDVDNDKLVHTLKTKHKESINVLAFSPDGNTIASGGRDGTLEVWDVSARQRFATLDSHTDTVNVVLFSPDGKMFASASKDGKVQLWDILTGKKAVLLTEPNKGVNALAFSPDGKMLVSGRLGGPIQVWDTTTHQHLGDFINAARSVDSLAFSPDGKILTSGSYDGSIRLWNVNSKTKIREIYSAHNDNVEKFAFTSDSKTLVSGSRDGTLLIWDLDKMGVGNR